jgi:hypothetical protein
MRLIALLAAGSLLAPLAAVSATDTAQSQNAAATTATVQALASTETAQALSATAQALSATAAEEDVEDDAEAVTNSAKLDLAKAETRLLAKISASMALTQDKVLFNLEDNAPTDKAGIGVDEVDVAGLYTELAKRAIAEDKDARQALTLAILRGDSRAKEAKNKAYENRLAESLIKRIDNGDKGAKDELMKQALAGNEKARLYLGLDKPEEGSTPQAVSGEAKAMGEATSLSPAAASTTPASKGQSGQ